MSDGACLCGRPPHWRRSQRRKARLRGRSPSSVSSKPRRKSSSATCGTSATGCCYYYDVRRPLIFLLVQWLMDAARDMSNARRWTAKRKRCGAQRNIQSFGRRTDVRTMQRSDEAINLRLLSRSASAPRRSSSDAHDSLCRPSLMHDFSMKRDSGVLWSYPTSVMALVGGQNALPYRLGPAAGKGDGRRER
jgi:hypothetical protein